MGILADVVSVSHVIDSSPADVADGSDAVVPLALDVAELQSLSLVASDALCNVDTFVASSAAVEITVRACILADVVSLSDIEIGPADIAFSSC